MSTSTIPEDAITITPSGDIGIITYKPLIPSEIEASVRSKKAGAVVSFVGYTRDEFQGKEVIQLEYESYIPLAIKTLHQILLEARQLPPPILPSTTHCFDHTHHHSPPSPSSLIEITKITIYHLLGSSPPLTPSLVISVSSPHRKEAFVVCEWLLETIKMRLQIWKKEIYKDGTVFVGKDGEGVEGSRYVWKENFPVEGEGEGEGGEIVGKKVEKDQGPNFCKVVNIEAVGIASRYINRTNLANVVQ